VARYKDFFQCPVRFNRPRNALSFDLAWIDRPAVLADRGTHALTRELCEQLFTEVSLGGGIAAAIRRILIEGRGRFPTIDEMAQRLALHPRALRRRLDDAGTSYRVLLEDVRKSLAIEYLRKTQMTNEEIASRLAYSDAANFRRAFARGTGKHPSDFRHPAHA
jgi:AraC-like DNA-binding protein